MPQDRRSFIRRFGVTLGSLIASGSLPGCGKKKEGESSKTGSQVKKQDEPSPTPRSPEWEQLRQCWLKLDDDNRKAERDLGSFFITEEAVKKERTASRRALDTLVAKGELKEPVAKHMQTALEEAANHIVRSMATCYIVLPIEHAPRNDLLQQADVLRKISGDLDPATVAKAQTAIAQDVAFFEIFKTSPNDYVSLHSNYHAGSLKVSSEALEAARLLAQLFLETPD